MVRIKVHRASIFTQVFARLPAMDSDIEEPHDLDLPSQALLYEPSMCQ